MKEQIKPRKLKTGARIGIVNPAYWLEEKRLRRAVDVFANLGYDMVLGESTALQENQSAGSPSMVMEAVGIWKFPKG